ncbi:putative histone H2B type 2-C, partial [Orchesella cincta]
QPQQQHTTHSLSRLTESSIFYSHQVNQTRSQHATKGQWKGCKKAGKAQKNISKGDGKKRKHKRKESYAIYIYKVLKAGSPRHWSLLQSHVHHELLCQRHFRSVLLLRLPVLLTTTRGPPSPLGKSKLQCVSFFPESWPNTPSLKEPRLSPSTPPPNKLPANGNVSFHMSRICVNNPNGPSKGHHNFQRAKKQR